jgi:putative heme iron utilization protein
MTPEQIQDLIRLLETQRILALSVVIESQPYVGLLPYALTPDRTAVLVHASGLARHARGLQQGAPFGVLIHQPDRSDADPLQIERVMLQGSVDMLTKGSAEYEQGRRGYLERFPSSEQTFMLGDFNLYRLRFEGGRHVRGFAQAVNVTANDLSHLASAPASDAFRSGEA